MKDNARDAVQVQMLETFQKTMQKVNAAHIANAMQGNLMRYKDTPAQMSSSPFLNSGKHY